MMPVHISQEGRVMFNRVLLSIIGMLLFFVTAVIGCQGQKKQATQPSRPIVVTTLFPLYDFARTIAGDRMEVQLLLPPGVEPHHFEPKPDDLVHIHRAALFVYIGPFMEPWADKIIQGVDRTKVRVVPAAAGIPLLPAMAHSGKEQHHLDHDHDHDHQVEAYDPHVWLDFNADQTMVAKILEALIAADPAGAEQYRRRAADLTEQLSALDARYKAGLASCDSRVLLHGGHAAFGYLAHRYNLDYQAAAGVTAELEATPRRLAELVQQVRKNKVKAVFSEELVSPRVARTIAGETGATVLKLHGAHNVAKEDLEQGVTFIKLMDENLKNLQVGLSCKN
jgi:zinc transport system substrate-binding protein